MSITLKIDDDVAALLARLLGNRDPIAKELVNHRLSRGLQETAA